MSSPRITEPKKPYSPHGWKEEDSEAFMVQPSGEVTPMPRERPVRRGPGEDPLAKLKMAVRERSQQRSAGDPPRLLVMWVVGASALSLLGLVVIAVGLWMTA